MKRGIAKGAHRPGDIVLKGGDELFFNEHVHGFFNYLVNFWRPPDKRIALYLGCSWHKPFSRSFIHLKVMRMLERHGLDHLVQQFIISEPLTICPRELEDVFPAANYDFPPERLSEDGRKVFIARLRGFMAKYGSKYNFHVGFLPNHYKEIFVEASEGLVSAAFIPYNIYQLPNLLNSLKELARRVKGGEGFAGSPGNSY